MQFENVRKELQAFKNREKCDFRKNGNFKTAVSLQRLNEIKFCKGRFEGLGKTFQTRVAKYFYLQNSIYGVCLKMRHFRKSRVSKRRRGE